MKRAGVEVGLTLALAVGALLTACRRPCGTWRGCCAPVAAPAPDGAAAPDDAAPPAPVEPDTPKTVKASRTWRDKRVRGLTWEEVNLDVAVAWLRTVTGKSFTISPKAREEKFDDIVLSLQLDDVAVKDVLGLITEPWDLRWEEREGVVWILTNQEMTGPIKLRFYDIKDLGVGAAQPVPVDAAFVKNLEEDIEKQVFPGYWERPDVSLETRNGILIARAQRPVHDAIESFLRVRRAETNKKTISDTMREKLESIQVSLAASNTTVGDLVKVLQIQTGMNLMIDPRIVSDTAQNPVTGIKLESVALWTALQMLAAAAGEGAVWADEGNVVMLTRTEFLGAGAK